MKKYIIFGAGTYGKKALESLHSEQVDYFLDNDERKWGTSFCGKKIISVDEGIKLPAAYHIVIASIYAKSMSKQLDEKGISDYSFFLDELSRFYETDDIVFNPYETVSEAATETEWKNSKKLRYAIQSVYEEVERIHENIPLFNHIEVETFNRCNGTCSFCPVNRNVDPRQKAMMTQEMFEDIVGQLEEIQYEGRFTTFSNNEPLLDERIFDFNRYARKHLPKAKIHLFTNGTLFTLDKFKALIDSLDELIIDNYQQDLKLIKPCVEIKDYCEQHPELRKKVTIVLRKPQEILTTRGGTAPNRQDKGMYANERCVLPYKQMIIRPDGKVSLCCNDAIGRFTLGDLKKEKLLDIWYGQRFSVVRESLYKGRENWGSCQYCDTFSLG